MRLALFHSHMRKKPKKSRHFLNKLQRIVMRSHKNLQKRLKKIRRWSQKPNHAFPKPARVLFLLIILLTFVPNSQIIQAQQTSLMQTDSLFHAQNISNILAQKAPKLNSWQRWSLAVSTVLQAQAYEIDPYLILSVIKVESNFDPYAKSSVGALGLMQIRPFVGKALAKSLDLNWRGKVDLFSFERNIKLGTHYLNQLQNQFDYDLVTVLTAYNQGPTRVDGWLKNQVSLPLQYSNKVLKAYQEFSKTLS